MQFEKRIIGNRQVFIAHLLDWSIGFRLDPWMKHPLGWRDNSDCDMSVFFTVQLPMLFICVQRFRSEHRCIHYSRHPGTANIPRGG